MPRAGKVKIQWIVQKSERQASFRKRRGTLFDKARDLSILCQVPAAVIVYGGGEAQPQVWPGIQEVTGILQRYRDLPDSLKEARRLDNELFMRRRTEKMRRKLDNCRASASRLEVNLILNDISLGRRREFADLPRELTGAVVSGLDALRSVTADRVNFLRSEAAKAAALPQQQLEEAVAAALMALQESRSPMVPPVAMAPPMVANAPLVQPAPPQSALVVPPPPQQLQPMVPPLAMAPVVAGAPLLLPAPEPEPPVVPPLSMAPMVADAPLLLPAVEPEPPAAAAGAVVDEPLNLYAEPRDGSFLLEMADAIMHGRRQWSPGHS